MTGVRKLINRVRHAGSLLDKKPAGVSSVFVEEKLDEWELGQDTYHRNHRDARSSRP